MFSGIHSLFFGKKHKHKSEDFSDERSQSENDFVVLERRHSDDYDKNSGLYPSLDPSKPNNSNLPYAMSPSLPNLNDENAISGKKKEDMKIDMLQAVPFVLSPEILFFIDEKNRKIRAIEESLNHLKDSGEESYLDNYSYDFELENSISVQYS